LWRWKQIGDNGKVPVVKDKASLQRLRFGENLMVLRKARNLTQEAVAEEAGTSMRYIKYLEAGENFPDLAILIRLQEILECSWNELFEGCGRDLKKAQK
jgi:transcriptional regulator with XRE-family HTH domain